MYGSFDEDAASGRRRRRAARAAAVTAAVALSVLTGGAAAAGPAPVVTRAALDPSLVAGRGAAVGFLEQEAEHARTTGTVIGPDRSAYTLAGEASGRRAVRLNPGAVRRVHPAGGGRRDHRPVQHPGLRPTAAASPRPSTSPSATVGPAR